MNRRVATLLITSAALSLSLPADALTTGDRPPPIDLTDLSGQRVTLDDLRGKVVLVDFWASWCGPCREEMPVLQQLHQKYAAQGLVVVGVNIDKREERMRTALALTPVTFTIVRDKDLKVASRYKPSIMPSSYFIARDGTLRYIHRGFRKSDAPDLDTRLQALLAEPQASESQPAGAGGRDE